MSFIMDASMSVFAAQEVGDQAVELSRLLPLRPVSAFAEYVQTHVFQLVQEEELKSVEAGVGELRYNCERFSLST
jgi:hypothetical protein